MTNHTSLPIGSVVKLADGTTGILPQPFSTRGPCRCEPWKVEHTPHAQFCGQCGGSLPGIGPAFVHSDASGTLVLY